MSLPAEIPAHGNTQDSLTNSLIELLNHSFSRCHLGVYYLPDIMFGAEETLPTGYNHPVL